MSTSPKRLAVLASAALAVAGITILAPPAAMANPGGTDLVITEVYGGGGSANATASYKTDFVELFNPTGVDISVNGMSLQYRSATFTTGGSVSVATLPNKIVKAGGTFLAEVSGPNTTPAGGDLPAPDFASTALNMAQGAGQVILSSGITPITQLGDLSAATGVIDMVGYGNTPTSFEAARTGTATTITTSVSRTPTAGTDTNNNSLDFAAPATPSPVACGAPCVPPPPPVTPATIAEIQGDNATTSPMLNALVVTQGVVTAAYPSGGFFGFYMQTGGTGGATDPAARLHSDGIFVRQTVAAGAVTVVPGDSVEVTGTVQEFAGQTQVEVTAASDVDPIAALPAVTATTTTSWPDTDAKKEKLEGMLYTPQGNFTISDNFGANTFGELGLARGTQPLIIPTEVGAVGSPENIAQAAANAANAITLDDGSSTAFLSAQTQTPPYISNTTPYRTGATGTFNANVIFTQGGGASPTYRFEPLTQVVGPANTAAPYSVANTRTNAPDAAAIEEDGTAAVKVASFNVLNYFTTLGDANNDNIGDGGCTAFNDRAGDGNSVNGGCNQRGAWDPQDFDRQQTKIVAAINALDADVVGLMEIENSLALGETADEATQSLVTALNAASAPGTWAANPSSADLPPAGDMDVITNAIIYKPASVDRTGPALALGDQSAGTGAPTDEPFANAREPIGQVFTPDDGSEPFLVVVNHFKSKGSAGPFPGDADSGDGQGASNQSRIRQATALAAWIPTVQGDVDDVLLLGDFNSYTMEDPLQVLYDDGYQDMETVVGHDKWSYSFGGQSGSLDHVLGNLGAVSRLTGADVWNVNSVESIAMEYDRWNYHGTDFHTNLPFRASDHDPVVIGLDEGNAAVDEPETVQILATNDFHGRINNNTTAGNGEAGAAVLSGAVKQLRADPTVDGTVFAAAGDLIGASTFESFIAHDKPTIDALNEAGLEVSSVGNHEFDQGYDDLLNRVMAPYDATTNPFGGAAWQYLGANVHNSTPGSEQLAPTWVKDFGGVQVGFIGAVTEGLPSLVSPAGMQGVTVTSIVDETNEAADDLKAAGADVVILLVHEGAPTTSFADAVDPSNPFGEIVTSVNDNVDAIVSGHTHLAYNHSVPVPGWAGRAVTSRPVVSAGQYGTNLNQLKFTWDPAANGGLGGLTSMSQTILALKSATTQVPNYPADPAVTAIVNAANANADVLGAVELGKIAGPFKRAALSNGTTENRGGESTVGNLVAEVQRWSGGTQIAFMNPGGLRGDMLGNPGGYPATLTYKQAATIQPFANTLVRMSLTGAQLKTVLEQQWQTNPGGPAPARPFLRMGLSKGFTYTYDPDAAQDNHIKQMWLDGVLVVPGTSYTVTVNSFLASGGDNFRELNNGTGKQETGKTDLQAMVEYMAEFANTGAGDAPLPVDWSQRSVGVDFPGSAPTSYAAGGLVEFQLSSLAMTGLGDLTDSSVQIALDGTPVTTASVDNVNRNAPFDETGLANVSFYLSPTLAVGAHTLTVTGPATGTGADASRTIKIPITTGARAAVDSSVSANGTSMVYGTAGTIVANVTPSYATGDVQVLDGATVLGTGTLSGGSATINIPGTSLQPGSHSLTVKYLGEGTATGVKASQKTITVDVAKAAANVNVSANPTIVTANSGTSSITVSVAASGFIPTGTVNLTANGAPAGTLTLVNGVATGQVGPFASTGLVTIDASYVGDAHANPSLGTAAISVTQAPSPAKSDPKVTLTLGASSVAVKDGHVVATASVTATGGTPTGPVTFLVDGVALTTVSIVNGVATADLGPVGSVGTSTVEARYLGDSKTNPGSTTATIDVVKAKPGMTLKVKPGTILADETKPRVVIKLTAPGQTVTGYVQVKVGNKLYLKSVKNGKVKVDLKPFGSKGKVKVVATYLGNEFNLQVKQKTTFKVVS